MNILHNREDADECVNDAYLSVWNAIPPQSPDVFATFIGRITRNLSLDRYRRNKAKKRGGDETVLILGELDLCIPAARNTEDEVDDIVLSEAVDDFLSKLRQEDRVYFMCRYWYAHSVEKIAEQFDAGVSKVKMSLHRTRKKLKKELEKRGFTI